MVFEELKILKALVRYGEVEKAIKDTEAHIKELTGLELQLKVDGYNASVLIESIVLLVSRELNVTIREILSDARDRDFVEARHIAITLCVRYISGITLKTVGAYFSRDHTSVIHAARQVKQLLSVGDPSMVKKFAKCKKALLKIIN